MQRLFNLLFFILLTACSSPKPLPYVPYPHDWPVKNKNLSQKNNPNLPYIAWWQGFNDPTLNDLIRCGLKANNSLNASRGHIEAAEGELKKVKMQWVPTLDFLTGYSNNPATGFPGTLALLIPSYTINIFSQVQEQKKANYELAAAKAEDDALKLTIISQIAISYFTYQAEVERNKLLNDLATDLTRLADIGRKVYRGGLSSDIDPQTLYSQVSQIQGEQEIIAHNIIISQNAIRYLINQNPGGIPLKKKFSTVNNHHLIAKALPLSVLQNRPDLQMAANHLQAANESIGLAASKLLPEIHLDLITGPVAGDNRYAVPKNMVYFNDQTLKMPLLKLTVLGEIEKARGLNKESFYNYVDTLQKALQQTTNAISANEHYTNKLNRTQRWQRHIAKAYNLNHSLYKQGIQSYMAILQSKIALDRANITLNQDKLQQLITVVNLYQELAGGYKADEPRDELRPLVQ